jgi:hypothetical protein
MYSYSVYQPPTPSHIDTSLASLSQAGCSGRRTPPTLSNDVELSPFCCNLIEFGLFTIVCIESECHRRSHYNFRATCVRSRFRARQTFNGTSHKCTKTRRTTFVAQMSAIVRSSANTTLPSTTPRFTKRAVSPTRRSASRPKPRCLRVAFLAFLDVPCLIAPLVLKLARRSPNTLWRGTQQTLRQLLQQQQRHLRQN